MQDRENPFVGTGTTPSDAVQALVPDIGEPTVEWVSGVEAVPDGMPPGRCDEVLRFDVTIIYSEPPLREWRIEVRRADEHWRAVRIGVKSVDL